MLVLNQIHVKTNLFFKIKVGHRKLKTFGDITSITVIKHREFDVRHLARL